MHFGPHDAVVQRAPVYLVFFGPLNHCLGLAECSHQIIIAPIAMLLRPIRPFTIGLFVTLVVFDTVKRQALGRVAHVGVKVLHLMPALANLDTPAAVILITERGGVVAARHHIFPYDVDTLAAKAVLGDALLEQAAAGLGISASEVATEYPGALATFAFTQPNPSANMFECREPAKLHSGSVYQSTSHGGLQC